MIGQVETFTTIGHGRVTVVHDVSNEGAPIERITMSTDKPLTLVHDADEPGSYYEHGT